jgi:2TM domain
VARLVEIDLIFKERFMDITFNSPAQGLSPEEAERLARRRAGAKLGWLIHAAVYLCVNAFLIALSWFTGKAWVIFPLMGWGLGLAIHGAAVWLASPGSALHEHLLQAERAKLAAQRDPW